MTCEGWVDGVCGKVCLSVARMEEVCRLNCHLLR